VLQLLQERQQHALSDWQAIEQHCLSNADSVTRVSASFVYTNYMTSWFTAGV
jgi:hypothetical protein